MRILVESLKRLYTSDKISKADLEERFKKGTITEEEFNYIVN